MATIGLRTAENGCPIYYSWCTSQKRCSALYINVRSLFNKLPGGEKRRQPVVEEQQLCYELFLCHSRAHSTEMAEERNAVVKILAVVSDRV